MTEAFPVMVTVDAARSRGPLRPIWRFFGCDEPNYACTPEGCKLLGELGELAPGAVYFRAHNLLTSGDGTSGLKWGSTNAYAEDAAGEPVYDWTILDGIFDAYRDAGVRPYVQIGFMPEALSVKPEPYRHQWTPAAKYDEIYTGWAYPPKDYDRWGELAHQWAAHCVERYGREEVEQWYWQTWNEPNIGYWRGTPEEFRRLNDHALAGVLRALPTARVGGPDTAGDGGAFADAFLDHCLRGTNHATGETGTPLHFVSFHAKGHPEFLDGHVRLGIAAQLRTIDAGLARVASRPELRGLPIVIGESDPDGCAACQGPQLGYRNGTMYASYTAASFARKHDLAERHGVNLEGALTWAFTFPGYPLFAGFRQLATAEIDLPVLNVFRMLARMGGDRLEAESTGAVPLDEIVQRGVREAPDVAALASQEGDRVCVLAWHYHDDDVSGPDAAVELRVAGLPEGVRDVRAVEYRIDAEHGNAFTAWQAMGAPPEPTPEQYAALEAAGKLTRVAGGAETATAENGGVTLRFTLPRQAVSLWEVEWDR